MLFLPWWWRVAVLAAFTAVAITVVVADVVNVVLAVVKSAGVPLLPPVKVAHVLSCSFVVAVAFLLLFLLLLLRDEAAHHSKHTHTHSLVKQASNQACASDRATSINHNSQQAHQRPKDTITIIITVNNDDSHDSNSDSSSSSSSTATTATALLKAHHVNSSIVEGTSHQ